MTTYGAFVDYGGGKDALIHISQLKVLLTCPNEPSDDLSRAVFNWRVMC